MWAHGFWECVSFLFCKSVRFSGRPWAWPQGPIQLGATLCQESGTMDGRTHEILEREPSEIPGDILKAAFWTFFPLAVILQKPVESEKMAKGKGSEILEICATFSIAVLLHVVCCLQLYQEKLDLPAGWITAMNHMFHTAQRVAVRSMAARYAGSWQVENWYLSQPSGPDLVIEVPLSRWDVDQYFDAEESWQRWR